MWASAERSPLRTVALAFMCSITCAGQLLSPTGTWTAVAPMAQPRDGASAVLLKDGRVLVTGGTASTGALATAEMFGSAGSFSPAAPMLLARAQHTSVVLADGRVLVAGGSFADGTPTNEAEVYDPTADSWAVTGIMTEARSRHTATLLGDGRVLIAGGAGIAGPVASFEIFDPTNGTFSVAGSLSSPRQNHSASVLPDARVLIAGGTDGKSTLATTEVFDPTANSVTAGPALSMPRQAQSATVLLDGKILVAGGNDGNRDLASAEVYDAAAGTFSLLTALLATPRQGHLAFLLPNNNQILIVGGTASGVALSSAELFTPWTGLFGVTGPLSVARMHATGAPLQQDGSLLVAGGDNLASAEVYRFATIKTDRSDYPPGQTVTIRGAGWQPGEAVNLTLHENPSIDPDLTFSAVADSSGTILNSQFATDSHDVGVRFTLTAIGRSGNSAQTTFLDSASTDLAVTKVGPVTAKPGTDITYTITWTNNGPDTASNVTVTDTLPGGETLKSFTFHPTSLFAACSLIGTINCSTTSMPNGSSIAADVVVHLDAGLADGTVLNNTATVATSAGNTDPNPGNNSSTATTTVALPRTDLSVTKVGPATALPGTDITYTITWANNGPDDASSVAMTDTLPAGETLKSFTFHPTTLFAACSLIGTINCSTTSMPSGSSIAADVVVHLDPGLADGTVLSNTAVVATSAGNIDPNPANNSSTATTTIRFPRTDLSVTKVGPATARPGTDITYTLTWTNNGPDTASNVNVTDTLPVGETLKSATFHPTTLFSACSLIGTINCNTTSMPSGSSVAIDLVVHLDPGLADGTILGNTAIVATSAGNIDPNSGNNSSTATTTIRFPRTDLSVTKVGPATALPGTDITYTLTWANNGPDTASNVNVTDTLPAGETLKSATFHPTTLFSACSLIGTINCNTTSMPSGSSVAIDLVVHLDAALANGTVLNNTATAATSAGNVDPNPANNSSTASTLVTNIISGTVQLTTTATLTRLISGDYQASVTIKNIGTGTAVNVQMTGALLGAAGGSPLPQILGNINPGTSVATTVTFPASAGASGSAVIEKYAGTYSGGTFGAGIRAVLP